MGSNESNAIDQYLADVPADRRDALIRLRAMCRDELTGFTEDMAYGMPSYRRDGVVEVAFANQKQYISIYILRTDVRDAHTEQLAGLNMGKGCLRYRKPEAIDFDLVRSILHATATTRHQVC